RTGQQGGVRFSVDEHAHVHELIRKEHVVVVWELSAQLDGSGRRVDLIVGSQKLAGRELHLLRPIPRLDGQSRAGFHPREHLWQVVLRDREQHRDRLHLRDDNEPVGIGGMDHVARIDLSQTHNARDRRRDAGVGQVQLRAVDLPLIGRDRPFVLAYQRFLRIDLLLRNRILREQSPVSFQVELRVLEERLVLGELPLRLRQLHLKGSRIDLGQELASLHELTLLERHAHQLTVDARAYRDHIAGGHRPERIEINVDAALRHRGRYYRQGFGVGIKAAFSAPSRLVGGLAQAPPQPGNRQEKDHRGAQPRSAARQPNAYLPILRRSKLYGWLRCSHDLSGYLVFFCPDSEGSVRPRL